jgi:tRNA threonylcarbamoyladenosine biosynthesis protein TsaE
MLRNEFFTTSAEETIALGISLSRRLNPPLVILLSGELGAGKTTLAKGIISGLGAARVEEVTSPTFTLVHTFANSCRVFHVDLYRVVDFHSLESLGLEDLFATPSIILVEWPEHLRFRINWPVWRVFLEHLENGRRRVVVEESAGGLAQPA